MRRKRNESTVLHAIRVAPCTSSPLEKGRAEGAGWMCLEEAPFYATVSIPTVQSATPYRHQKRSRGIFAALVCDVTSGLRNESTVLHAIRVAPWRRGAPKAQDGCASKRHPFYAAVSMTTVQSATLYRQRKRSREIFATIVCDVTSRLRNESTVLHMIRVGPWRRESRRGTSEFGFIQRGA